MNSDFLTRTGIEEAFNPFHKALWAPNEESIEEMKRLVNHSVAESTLPTAIKDQIADKNYDRSRPYHQELIRFIEESTLIQLIQAMRGAARALRNSDHVSPLSKMELLEEVLKCWTHVCQTLVILSPILAERKRASFEGINFYLDKSFDKIETVKSRWDAIMAAIPDNVVDWYQENIFSKKMGALFSRYIESKQSEFSEFYYLLIQEFLILLVMTKQRPPGWEKELENFILRTNKNSFYLSRIQASLQNEYKISFSSEQTRQQLRKLAAMSAAKHLTGSKKPNSKLVERVATQLELDSTKKKEKRIGGQFLDRDKRKKLRLRRKSRGKKH